MHRAGVRDGFCLLVDSLAGFQKIERLNFAATWPWLLRIDNFDCVVVKQKLIYLHSDLSGQFEEGRHGLWGVRQDCEVVHGVTGKVEPSRGSMVEKNEV